MFEPGSGSQVHDFNGAIQPSGLFWTVRLPNRSLRVSDHGRRATLVAVNVPVIDNFNFTSTDVVPATVSFKIVWRATGSFADRGSGNAVEPADPAAFSGHFARAKVKASFSGQELGFRFSGSATAEGGYAQMGTERNGSFLP